MVSMLFSQHPFTRSFGAVLEPGEDKSLRALLGFEGWSKLLDESKLILVREASWDLATLKEFSRCFMSRTLRYGGNRDFATEDGHIQFVESGREKVNLHSELAFTPFRPDVCLFACQRPSDTGGETTVGDTRAILKAIKPDTRSLLESQPLAYTRVFPGTTWQRMLGTTDVNAARAYLDRVEGLSYKILESGDVWTRFVTPAILKRGDVPAFSSNIVTVLDTQEALGSDVTFANDERIPEAIVEELRTVLASHEIAVNWRPGDILVLENWHALHGRYAFTDDKRSIVSMFGYR